MKEADTWKPLYRAGALAALTAAILFRRNIGAEVSLFTGVEAIPTTVADWYALLQTNPFVGLSFLAVFDLVNYALVGVIFLALGAALWQANKSLITLALASGLVGVTLNLASNISLTMLSLSQHYAATTSAAQSADLLAACGELVESTCGELVESSRIHRAGCPGGQRSAGSLAGHGRAGQSVARRPGRIAVFARDAARPPRHGYRGTAGRRLRSGLLPGLSPDVRRPGVPAPGSGRVVLDGLASTGSSNFVETRKE